MYIGGVTGSAQCFTSYDTYQNSSNVHWIDHAVNTGWGVVPIWDAKQAPCESIYSNTMPISPSNANTQGSNAADQALTAMSNLGFSSPGGGKPPIVYLDIESYQGTFNSGLSGCSGYTASDQNTAVIAYIQGWTDELVAQGDFSGVYGSASSSEMSNWWSGGSPAANQALLADWNGIASVWGLGGINDAPAWNTKGDQRIVQFWNDCINGGWHGPCEGQPLSTPDLTINGIQIGYDFDCMMGRVDPNGSDDHSGTDSEPSVNNQQQNESGDGSCASWFWHPWYPGNHA